MQVAVDAINKGHVFRYLTKPWQSDDLVSVLDAAVDLVRMRRTVADLQARVLRGTAPPMIETVLNQVAAELRTPLARLEMGSEQLGDLLDASMQSWDSQERAQELIAHARSVQVESMRPVATLKEVVQRLERGQRLVPEAPPPSCDVSRIARAAVRIVGTSLPSTVKVQLELSDAPVARIDAADLGQAIVHLLAHAAQAAEQSSAPSVRIAVRAGHTGVEVHVIDSGAAIAPEHAERVFDPYFVSRGRSGGVGLALVKRLITQAGGSVYVSSPEAEGAHFVLRLPMVASLALG
jgi:signal transduction histidine kinase